jgi:hypothetical protein
MGVGWGASGGTLNSVCGALSLLLWLEPLKIQKQTLEWSRILVSLTVYSACISFSTSSANSCREEGVEGKERRLPRRRLLNVTKWTYQSVNRFRKSRFTNEILSQMKNSVFTRLVVKFSVLWHVTPCRLLCNCWCFQGTCGLQLRGDPRKALDLEYTVHGGKKYLRNVDTYTNQYGIRRD